MYLFWDQKHFFAFFAFVVVDGQSPSRKQSLTPIGRPMTQGPSQEKHKVPADGQKWHAAFLPQILSYTKKKQVNKGNFSIKTATANVNRCYLLRGGLIFSQC